MGKRQSVITQDHIYRAIAAVKKAGIEIKTIRIEPDGSLVINGDRHNVEEKDLAKIGNGYL